MAEQIFIKASGITGSSTSAAGTGEVEIMSYSYGVSMPVTHGISGSQRTHGKVNVQDVTISKFVENTSPVWIQHCAEGKVISTLTIRHLRADGQATATQHLMTIEMSDALVTSVSGGGSDQPMENISFNFTKIKWTYAAQGSAVNAAGNIVATINLKESTVATT